VAIVLEMLEEEAVQLEVTPRAVRGRHPRVALAAALLVVVAGLVFVFGNERQANSQFEQAHESLLQTNSDIAAVEVQLSAVRRDLQFLKVQISSSEAALSSDSALLQSVRTALLQAQKDASDQSSSIANLKTCQGGVQQALNALSVGDQNHAVSALRDVSSACQSAAASGG